MRRPRTWTCLVTVSATWSARYGGAGRGSGAGRGCGCGCAACPCSCPCALRRQRDMHLMCVWAMPATTCTHSCVLHMKAPLCTERDPPAAASAPAPATAPPAPAAAPAAPPAVAPAAALGPLSIGTAGPGPAPVLILALVLLLVLLLLLPLLLRLGSSSCLGRRRRSSGRLLQLRGLNLLL